MFQNSEITSIEENLFYDGTINLVEGSMKGMFKGCKCNKLYKITLNIGSIGASSLESMFEGWDSVYGGTSGYSPLIVCHNLNNTIPRNNVFKKLFYGSGVTMVRFGYNYNTGSPYTPDSGATEDWLTNLTYGSGLVIGFDWWDLSDLPSGWT